LSQRGIRRVGLPEKKHLQPIEMLRSAVMHELLPQFLNDSIEQRSAQRRSKIRSGVSSATKNFKEVKQLHRLLDALKIPRGGFHSMWLPIVPIRDFALIVAHTILALFLRCKIGSDG
jgi:hypothetical protein